MEEEEEDWRRPPPKTSCQAPSARSLHLAHSFNKNKEIKKEGEEEEEEKARLSLDCIPPLRLPAKQTQLTTRNRTTCSSLYFFISMMTTATTATQWLCRPLSIPYNVVACFSSYWILSFTSACRLLLIPVILNISNWRPSPGIKKKEPTTRRRKGQKKRERERDSSV